MTLDPSEYSVQDLRSDLREVDDARKLTEILEAEKQGQDRKTAKSAIRGRRNRVSDDDPADEDDDDDDEPAEPIEVEDDDGEEDDSSDGGNDERSDGYEGNPAASKNVRA